MNDDSPTTTRAWRLVAQWCRHTQIGYALCHRLVTPDYILLEIQLSSSDSSLITSIIFPYATASLTLVLLHRIIKSDPEQWLAYLQDQPSPLEWTSSLGSMVPVTSTRLALNKRAVNIIKEKLPLMGELKAVVTVNLGEGRPLLIIDARLGEARLREKIDVKPDTELTIKPDYICQFYEDRLEVRYGLFVHAFFHHFGMPKGSIPIAIKFGDLLTPHVPMPPKPYKPGDETPVPSEDVEQAKQDLEKYGYALVKNALTPEQVVILKRAVLQQAAGEVRVGVATQDGGPNNPNQRLWSLSNKGDEFLDLLNHSLIDAIVPSLLGEHAILNDYSANIARPGNVPTQLHMDQIAIQPSLRNIACGITILWFLADVTEKNGGTRVFPGSHTGNVAPADLFDFDGTVAAEGRAGTALVMDSRLWHATGLNTETSGERPILITIFVRLFIRRRENYFLSLRPEVEAKISNRIKRLLGFYTTGALGGVEGEIREGIYVKRVENPIGPLREAGVA